MVDSDDAPDNEIMPLHVRKCNNRIVLQYILQTVRVEAPLQFIHVSTDTDCYMQTSYPVYTAIVNLPLVPSMLIPSPVGSNTSQFSFCICMIESRTAPSTYTQNWYQPEPSWFRPKTNSVSNPFWTLRSSCWCSLLPSNRLRTLQITQPGQFQRITLHENSNKVTNYYQGWSDLLWIHSIRYIIDNDILRLYKCLCQVPAWLQICRNNRQYGVDFILYWTNRPGFQWKHHCRDRILILILWMFVLWTINMLQRGGGTKDTFSLHMITYV